MNDRFKITVEFTVLAESVDDAESEVNDIIQAGMLALVDDEREPLDEYDIVEAEPAEIF